LSDPERLTRLEQQMTNVTQMNLSARLDNMQQQIQQLQGQLEVATHNLQTLTDQQTNFDPRLDQRISQLSKSGPAIAAATTAQQILKILNLQQQLLPMNKKLIKMHLNF